MQAYWEKRFESEENIWGDKPSNSVYKAISLFNQNHLNRILVSGAGYGRNTKELSKHFHVDGIEISSHAIRLAQEFDSTTTFIHDSVLDLKLDEQYEGIYCYNLLHLFMQEERHLIVDNCKKALKDNGIAFFTVFSDKDHSNKQGLEVEPGTYEYKQDKIAHFFTEQDLREHFVHFQIIDCGEVKEQLSYHNQSHAFIDLRYIVVRANKSIYTK
ncbi:class I SAM-dependent methyltransferase [Paenibacillus sp. NPDC058177]|uniref:class I SAM-dependent methyltransferase n=1 Tax=Paenibacillus sp. NPDC058177 TaxID=3346369 RepID=UPI0036D7AB85